jgi:hypothetical protein
MYFIARALKRNRSLPISSDIKSNEFDFEKKPPSTGEIITRSVTDSCIDSFLPNLYYKRISVANTNESSIEDINLNIIKPENEKSEDEIDSDDEEDYNEAIRLSLLM